MIIMNIYYKVKTCIYNTINIYIRRCNLLTYSFITFEIAIAENLVQQINKHTHIIFYLFKLLKL